MNPDEFTWKEDQQVTVINPTAETYKFKVHNKEYQLGAGQQAKMPGYIAWVYVYGLSTQLAQADGTFNRWNEEGYRQEYYEKLVSGIDNIVQSVEVQPKPLVEPVETPEEDEDEEPVTEEADLPAGGETYQPSVAPMEAKPRNRTGRRGRSTSRA